VFSDRRRRRLQRTQTAAFERSLFSSACLELVNAQRRGRRSAFLRVSPSLLLNVSLAASQIKIHARRRGGNRARRLKDSSEANPLSTKCSHEILGNGRGVLQIGRGGGGAFVVVVVVLLVRYGQGRGHVAFASSCQLSREPPPPRLWLAYERARCFSATVIHLSTVKIVPHAQGRSACLRAARVCVC